MNCDINFLSCTKNKKQDIIELAIKCKVFNKINSKYTSEEICKLINKKYETEYQYKKLCIIQDV